MRRFAPKLPSILVVLLLLQMACHPAKQAVLDEQKVKIHFGQGGGFTGQVTHYILQDDGKLFELPWRDTVPVLQKKLSPALTRQIFKSWFSLGLDKLNDQQPGDLYYFIRYEQPAASGHEITWGRSGFFPDPNLVKYYNLLFKSAKPNS